MTPRPLQADSQFHCISSIHIHIYLTNQTKEPRNIIRSESENSNNVAKAELLEK